MVLIISSQTEFDSKLQESTNGLKLMIVDFYTNWCGPCLQFAPIFEMLSNEYSAVATFAKVDCDVLLDLAVNLNIRALPTVKAFFNNQEAFSLSGSQVVNIAQEIQTNAILPPLKELCKKYPDAIPHSYLLKVIDNIIKSPTTEKYRILKLNNITVQQNLLAYNGVKEILVSLGFKEEEGLLHMDQPTSLDLFNQYKKQLSMIVASLTSKSSSLSPNISPKATPGQSSNSNVKLLEQERGNRGVSAQTVKSTTSVSMNTELNPEAIQFLSRIYSCRTKIEIYENIDLMNMVNAIVEIDTYKIPNISQETVLKKLLRWFKYDFFSWFNAPNCSSCNKPYFCHTNSGPTQEESKWLAFDVEIYACQSCSTEFRFPRYNHPEKLLITRTGRCGEWANCFCMILRAFINDGIFENARFVMDWSDHVWCEVYMKLDDESDLRWVHVDPCEGTYNAPLTYEIGWNKQIDYVIGITLITADVQDITWRYTNDFRKTVGNRRLIDENHLVNKLINFHKEAGTDIKIIFKELVSFLPSKNDNVKLSAEEMMGRTTGSIEWRSQRGEIGNEPIWKKKMYGKSIKPTPLELKNNCVHIQYNCSIDAYQRPCDVECHSLISKQGEVGSSSSRSTNVRKPSTSNKNRNDLLSHDTEGWKELASSWVNIKRKVEYDWQVVYLARMDKSPANSAGEISWTIDLSGTNKKIAEISVFASSAEFKNSSVKWKLHSDANVIPINGFLTTSKFNDFVIVTLTALLESDPSTSDNTAWQHTQLCRQKSTDFDVQTLQIKVDLRDSQ